MSKSASANSETGVLGIATGLTTARGRFAFAIVVEAQGFTSARAGAKAVFDADGSVVAGRVDGGCAELTIAHAVIEYLETEAPQVRDITLDDEVLGAGMPCGGPMRVCVEPGVLRPTLWILRKSTLTSLHPWIEHNRASQREAS
jgi:xanthine dehydrogenase accessory factor